jgi:23S rRNA pseudouridine1911/1915/1917 synthase
MVIEYENPDLVIVNKPAGLPVYSTKKHEREQSVVSWLLERYPKINKVGDPDRPGIVHRLDRQTSGLLVVAKTQEAFEYLKKLFSSRNITKEYLALVYGELPKHGVIDKPLTKIGLEGQSRVRVDERGKVSVTEYWALGYYKKTSPSHDPFGDTQGHLEPGRTGEGEMQEGAIENSVTMTSPAPPHEEGKENSTLDHYTLLRVKLHTGRTHQIRVHFASIKHPVMGDNLYGKPNSLKLKEILPRQFLHASRLEFKLMDGTWLEVESELPEDLKKVINSLQIYE